ncbi:unannotated protein [freshwater metagenome]|uniref:Unannotated protein n=1 Tax=freshwater metagenome TaxID=449393 RepID=A0A6J6DVV1_9ZZZZ
MSNGGGERINYFHFSYRDANVPSIDFWFDQGGR